MFHYLCVLEMCPYLLITAKRERILYDMIQKLVEIRSLYLRTFHKT